MNGKVRWMSAIQSRAFFAEEKAAESIRSIT